ncbi:MAG: 30S ribosomal protein S2 [Candidatus Omnitrophica bacterium]|nr:30S ribosomal protein S2 [Candidatus Omnitrophota bacterium]
MGASPLIQQLLDAGVHFGHQTKRWNPKMKPFIFGSRAGIHVIDLEQTEQRLLRAGEAVEQFAAKGALVLFVGTKKQAKRVVEEAAARCGMPCVTTRWMGGTLTNYAVMKRNIDRLLLLRKQREEGYFSRLSKKDSIRLERELERLEETYSGLASMDRLPACLYIIDPKREQNAVREANRLQIPIVAICDTNADPDVISYSIPGNDDAIRSVRLITAFMADRVEAGRRQAMAVTPVSPQPVSSEAVES